MKKEKLINKFINAWVHHDLDDIAGCISKKVKLITAQNTICSNELVLKHASEVFATLKRTSGEVIPIYNNDRKSFELIYTFILPVAVANGEMVTDDSKDEAYLGIRKVFVKTYVYFEFNLFKIKKITFSEKEIL